MSRLRRLGRAGGLAAGTLACYLACAAGLVLLLPAPAARRRWRCACFRSWARLSAHILGMRVSVGGEPPRPPFLLVANHLSYLDVLVLAGRVDALFIARADVRHWPIVGHLCRLVGTIFVERELRRDVLRVNRQIERALACGEGVVLFPEGTSTEGVTVGAFRPSLLELAARRPLPVHHASLSYRTPMGQPPARLAVCWWGEMPFLSHFSDLLALPGFEASLTFGPLPIEDSDRKRLAVRLRDAVAASFVPVADPVEEPCQATMS